MLRGTRLSSALLLAALVPACHGDGRGGSSPILLSDDFGRPAVGNDWSASGASAGIDAARGNPSPGLRLSGGASTADTTLSFPARPLTITVDAASVAPGEGFGGVAVVDGAGDVPASAELSGLPGSGWTFGVGDATAPFGGSAAFQRLVLHVDEQGNASWTADGAQVMTRSGFPAGPVRLRMFTRPVAGGDAPAFVFDNVEVTTP